MLEDEIRKAIEANLPAQIGKVLQERLAKVEKLEGDVTGYRRQAEERAAELQKHNAIGDRIEAVKIREAAAIKRESDLLAREVRQDLICAERNAANERCKAIFELASMAFRNPRFTRFESESRQIPIAGGSMNYPSTQTETSTKSTNEGIE